MRKKFTAMLLSVIMVLTLLPITAFAAENHTNPSTKSESSEKIDRQSSVQAPNITEQPLNALFIIGDTAYPLSVEANVTDEGTLSFQWYSNTIDSNTGGTAISEATGSSYTPSVDTEGTTWYYCVVTNTLNGMTAKTVTRAARVLVVSADTSCGITVAGVEVTYENRGDVLGDGKVYYFPITNSLVLNNAFVDGSDTDEAIVADGDLFIILSGENICKGKVEAEGNINIDGFGSQLKVTTTKNNQACLSSKNGSIAISAEKLELIAEGQNTQAMHSAKDITINFSNVNVKGSDCGIFCDNGTVQSYRSTVTAQGGRYGINASDYGSIEISESTMTMHGTDAFGACANTLTVTDSDVSVSTDANGHSIWIFDTIKISNSSFTSQSPRWGILAGNLIVEDSPEFDQTSNITIQSGGENCISLLPSSGTGQFKVTPNPGVLMDVFTGNAQDGSDAQRIDGIPFSTETLLSNRYDGNYFSLREHVHEATHVPRKEASCTEEGNIAYWYCDACGKYFRDEALTDEITKEDTIIAITEHCGTNLQDTKKPAKPVDGNPEIPQTGGSNNMIPWFALLFVSAAGITAATLKNKKRRNAK